MIDFPFQITIDFDERITRKQQTQFFNRIWLKKMPEYFKYLLFLILFIYFIDSFRGKYNTILEFWLFTKLYIFLYIAILIVIYIYQRIKFQNLLDSFIKKSINENETSTTIELTDEYLRLKTINYDIKYNWKLIRYEHVKDSLYLHIMMPTPFQYIIDKVETTEYDKIIEILKIKSKIQK